MALHVCVRGIGIRRSKDLRAEIGKCPNSTNERKNMSTKTMKQRIALVAVSALTAGLFSVVSSPVANALTGDCTVQANGVAASAGSAGTGGTSFGIISGAGAVTATASVLMYASGTLTILVDNAAAADRLLVSGGTISGFTQAGTVTALSGLTQLTGTSGDGDYVVSIRPSGAGTPLVVKCYTATTSTSNGTLVDTITATVVTTVGTFDASKSFVKINTEATAIATAVLSNSDVADAQVISNGSGGVIAMTLKDSNGVEMPSSTSITAIATGGGVVSADGVTYSTAVTTTYGAAGYANILVAQGVANTPFKPVVSISVNGAAYTSKSFTLQGDIAKVTLSSPTIGLANASSNGTGAFYMSITDSAGNLLAKTASIAPSSLNAAVSAYSATASTEADVVAQTFTCTSATGTANLKYTITNAALATVTSNELAVKCAKAPSTYTASLDKASYAQGSIATLTITAKDSAGNAPADGSKLGTTGASALSITCGALMTAVTLPVTDADTWTSGVKTYKFTVGTTAGSYNCVVDLPLYNSASTPQAAQTIAYAIAGDGSASNSDVLKAIVSLIASINKQIAALQKALLARR